MSINVGNFTVNLEAIQNFSDAAYSIARLFVFLTIFFGLSYYLGRLSKEGHVLKKPSRFETELRNYAQGLMISVLYLFILGTLVLYMGPEVLTSIGGIIIIWFSIYTMSLLLIIEYANQRQYFYKSLKVKKEGILGKVEHTIKIIIGGGVIGVSVFVLFLLIVFTPLLIYIKFKSYLPLFISLSILILFVLLVIYPFFIGRSARFMKNKVSVYLLSSKQPLRNLILCQTTDVDYRFKKEDGEEVIVPIKDVKKIVYKPKSPKKESN